MQHRVVVEDATAMYSAVVNLVLEESEEKMVSQRARARRRLRARDDEEAILGRRERGVELEPEGSLLVPVDHGLVDCVRGCVVVVERCIVRFSARLDSGREAGLGVANDVGLGVGLEWPCFGEGEE